MSPVIAEEEILGVQRGPYHAPRKSELYKYVARAEISSAEAAELIGDLRDWLDNLIAQAQDHIDSDLAQDLREQQLKTRKALLYLQNIATPIEWQQYLPAIRIKDPLEAQQ